MSDIRVGLAVFGATLVLAWWLQSPFVAVLGLFAGVWALSNAREWSQYNEGSWDLPSSAPRIEVRDRPSIDLDDDLADLIESARRLAVRRLEDRGRLDPFVMFEDHEGNVKVRSVDAMDRDSAPARARVVARELDQRAPRVVTVTPGDLFEQGRRRPAIVMEAAERAFRARTLVFAQYYRPKRGPFGAKEQGLPFYLGDGGHVLRSAAEAG